MIVIERNQRQNRSISMTPLIDVVFLLMMFFILTTNYVDIEALKLAVMEEETESTSYTTQAYAPHELVLLGTGAIFLNNQLVNYGDLEDKLEVLFAETPDTGVRLRCDNKVEVQQMIDVLDMIKRSGGQDVNVSHWKNGAGGL